MTATGFNKESGNLVTMSNDLVKTGYKMTLNEMRLFLVALAQLPKANSEIDYSSMEKIPCYIRKSDMIAMGVPPKNVLTEIRQALANLSARTFGFELFGGEFTGNIIQNSFSFKSDDFKAIKERINKERELAKSDKEKEEAIKRQNFLIGYYELEDVLEILEREETDIVARLYFSKEILPFVSDLEEKFTKLDLEEVSYFSSFYSYRVYLMLMQWRNTGRVVMEIDEFRKALSLGDKYDKLCNLRSRVLDTAMRDINEHSPFTCVYGLGNNREISTGRGRKATHVHFIFSKKVNYTPKGNLAKEKAKKQKRTAPQASDEQIAKPVEIVAEPVTEAVTSSKPSTSMPVVEQQAIIEPSKPVEPVKTVEVETVEPSEPVQAQIPTADNDYPPPKVKINVEKPQDIEEQTWQDFLGMRRKQKLAMNKTVWGVIYDMLKSTESITGIAVNEILKLWISREWRTFQPNYITNMIKSVKNDFDRQNQQHRNTVAGYRQSLYEQARNINSDIIAPPTTQNGDFSY